MTREVAPEKVCRVCGVVVPEGHYYEKAGNPPVVTCLGCALREFDDNKKALDAMEQELSTLAKREG